MRRRDFDISSSLAEGGCECSAVRPAHAPSPSARMRRSGGNRSGRRVRRSGGSDGGSSGSRGTKNSSCASSRGFPPATSEDSLSEEKEEENSDGGQAPLERWEPAPPSPRAAEATEEQAPRASAEAPAAGRSTEESAHAVEVPARAAEGPAWRGGVWGRDGGSVGRGLSTRRALEEEETGLLHPEVGHRSSRHSVSRGVSLIFSISRLQGGADRPSPCACKGT
jgi:hypothetical protein